MKKTIALLLTVVMLSALAIPMVNAEADNNVYEVTQAQESYAINFTEDWCKQIKADVTGSFDISQDGKTLTITSTNGNFIVGGEIEQCSFNTSKVYTVEFSVAMDRPAAATQYVLVNSTMDGFYYGTAYHQFVRNYASTDVVWQEKDDRRAAPSIKKDTTTVVGYTMCDYRLVVDGDNGVLSIQYKDETDGWLVINTIEDYVLQDNDTNLQLYFGVNGWGSAVSVMISDVTVYEGYPDGAIAVEEQGKLLLNVGSLEDKQSGNYGTTYAPCFNYNNKSKNITYAYDTDDNIHTISSEDMSIWGIAVYGGATNLQLGHGQKYTITYLLDMNDNVRTGLAYSATGTQANTESVITQTTGATSISAGGAEGANGHYGSIVPPPAGAQYSNGTVFSDSGYAAFAVELDGYDVTVYVNGVRLLTYSTLNHVTNYTRGYSSNVLTLAFLHNFCVAGSTTLNPPLIKDIKVYSGLTVSNNYVEVIDGNTTEYLALEKSITEYELSSEKKEGYMFKGYVVNDAKDEKGNPKITKVYEKVATTDLRKLEKVFVPVMSEIWWQAAKVYGEDGVTDTGKRDVRFVSAIDSLNYKSIGYDVTITYGGNSYDNNNFDLKHVYSSLLASYGAEVVTLETLEYDDTNGGYITAFVIKNVPNNVGNIEVELTPYQVTPDGTKVPGDKLTVTLTPDGLNK